MALSVQAQDTIHYSTIPAHYYPRNDWWDCYDSISGTTGLATDHELATPFYSGDSLTIYGLAGMFQAGNERDTFSLKDLEQAVNCMRLYRYDTVKHIPVQVGEDLCMNLLPSSVSYYFVLDRYIFSPSARKPQLVYERYFETPIVVKDTFFVGFTGGTYYGSLHGIPNELVIGCEGFGAIIEGRDSLVFTFMAHERDGDDGWRRKYFLKGVEYFLYPILTPDTSRHPDDSTGVTAPDQLSRFVTVTPNPASTEVRVVSSLGLKAIEMYDMKGTLCLRREAGSMAELLNVSALPRGAYLLHIMTPVGTTVKKLLLR